MTPRRGVVLWFLAAVSGVHVGYTPAPLRWHRAAARGSCPHLQAPEHTHVGAASHHLLYGDVITTGAPCLTHKIAALTERDADALEHFSGQLEDSTRYTGARCIGLVRLALEVAYVAHIFQKRKSGEAYVTHPVAVACILAESRLDIESVVSGLLHDTVEDTELVFEDIQRLFGDDVRKIVEGETKVSKLPKMVRSELAAERGGGHRGSHAAHALNKQDEQVENLRSMFVAMAEDWRIVVVKLADRLHNMRTLEYMPPHKRISIAQETLEIFAPLAHRLGMWSFRSELADLSLKFLFPAEYMQLENYIESQQLAYRATLSAASAELEDRLSNDARLVDPRTGASRITITGRTKNIHSTWKKLQRRDCGVGEILDLVALRIVIDTDDARWTLSAEADDASICYHVLGKVHSIWTPLPRTLKDYISSPKPNGYRSLHTTVLVGTQPLEVQIRTLQMHAIAEYGAAAHWAYSEAKEHTAGRAASDSAADSAAASFTQGGSAPTNGVNGANGANGVNGENAGAGSRGSRGSRVDGDGAVPIQWRADDRRGAWLQQPSFSTSIAKWGQDVECAHEFMQLVRQELLGTRVFVFTESVDTGSTRILNLARGATLGDVAAVLGADVQTHVPLISGAPADLSRRLQNGEIVSFLERSALEDRLLRPPAGSSHMGSHMGSHIADGDFVGVSGGGGGSGGSGADPNAWASAVDEAEVEAEAEAGREMAGASSPGSRSWRVCKRCLPLPGDLLVCTTHSSDLSGDIDGEGADGRDGDSPSVSLTLHRANCGCLTLRRQMAAGERLIRPTPALTEQYREKLDAALSPFTPNGGTPSSRRDVYTTKVIVFTTDRPGLLLAVSAVVTAESLNILDVHSKTWEVGVGSAFQYKVLIADVEQLERLTASLEAMEDVVRVIRGDMDDMLHDLGSEGFWQNAIP